MYKERENVGEEGEMPGIWDDLDSVRNSEDFGLEPCFKHARRTVNH